MTVPVYEPCRFMPCYSSEPCGAASIGGLCEKHDGVKCTGCGAQATHECNYTGQFVCGAPLCDDCHGYNEPGPSGAWGFIGHRHKPKDAPTKAEQTKREKNEAVNLSAESAALGVDEG